MEKTESNINRRILESPEIRAINEEERTIEFVASDSSVDSYGTVLPVEGWDLSRYEKNGVVGYQHDIYYTDDVDNVIGKGQAFIEDGKLIVRITFEPAELNEKADKIFRKVMFGSLNGVSVGFAPLGSGHWGDESRGEDPDVFYYGGQKLLEVSVVNIPSNENAVKRSMEEEKAQLPKKEERGLEAVTAEADNLKLSIATAKAILAQS